MKFETFEYLWEQGIVPAVKNVIDEIPEKERDSCNVKSDVSRKSLKRLYNEYEFSLKDENGLFFEGVEEEFQNEDNIIYMAIKKVFDKYDFKFYGLGITIIKQDIPISRGLGSSSSCIVAGLIGAFALMGKEINKDEILSLAVDIEGHPDNVCPAIFGGLVSTVMTESNKPLYNCIEIKEGI